MLVLAKVPHVYAPELLAGAAINAKFAVMCLGRAFRAQTVYMMQQLAKCYRGRSIGKFEVLPDIAEQET